MKEEQKDTIPRQHLQVLKLGSILIFYITAKNEKGRIDSPAPNGGRLINLILEISSDPQKTYQTYAEERCRSTNRDTGNNRNCQIRCVCLPS